MPILPCPDAPRLPRHGGLPGRSEIQKTKVRRAETNNPSQPESVPRRDILRCIGLVRGFRWRSANSGLPPDYPPGSPCAIHKLEHGSIHYPAIHALDRIVSDDRSFGFKGVKKKHHPLHQHGKARQHRGSPAEPHDGWVHQNAKTVAVISVRWKNKSEAMSSGSAIHQPSKTSSRGRWRSSGLGHLRPRSVS